MLSDTAGPAGVTAGRPDPDLDRLRRDFPRWKSWRAVRPDGSQGMWMANPRPSAPTSRPLSWPRPQTGSARRWPTPGPGTGGPCPSRQAPSDRPTGAGRRVGPRAEAQPTRPCDLETRHAPPPRGPGHTQEVVGRTVGELAAALAVHDRLDALRETYGAEWVIGADEVMPTWHIRWVYAQPRVPGAPAPPPVAAPEELEQLLAARTTREEVAP